MSTLYRVKQPKNCDYVGWQTYGRVVKEMSWASGGSMWCGPPRLPVFVDAAAGFRWQMGRVSDNRHRQIAPDCRRLPQIAHVTVQVENGGKLRWNLVDSRDLPNSAIFC